MLPFLVGMSGDQIVMFKYHAQATDEKEKEKKRKEKKRKEKKRKTTLWILNYLRNCVSSMLVQDFCRLWPFS